MFNGLAKLLSVGFIGSIDGHAERGSANGSKSTQQCVDPRDVSCHRGFKTMSIVC